MCSKRTDTHAQTHTRTHTRPTNPPTHPTHTHLEVAVLVDGAPGVRGHIPHGGDVQVLAGEQEEVHAAALSHTVLGQLLVHALHRVEQRLIGRQTHQSVNRSTGQPITTLYLSPGEILLRCVW